MSKNIYLPPGPPASLELAAQAEGLAVMRCAITRILCEFGRQAWLDALDNNLPCFLVRYADQIDDYLEAYDAGAEAPRLQHLLDALRPFYKALLGWRNRPPRGFTRGAMHGASRRQPWPVRSAYSHRSPIDVDVRRGGILPGCLKANAVRHGDAVWL